jgi:hypothetical protein
MQVDAPLEEAAPVPSFPTQNAGSELMVPFNDIASHNSDANAQMTLLDPEKDDAWFAPGYDVPFRRPGNQHHAVVPTDCPWWFF